MLRKVKNTVALFSLLSFLICGCGNVSDSRNSVQIKNETQETKSLIIPQYHLIETSNYKELKKQGEKARSEANELETKKNRLAAVYTAEYPPFEVALNNYEKAKQKLVQLEQLLNEETEKLEKRPVNPPI